MVSMNIDIIKKCPFCGGELLVDGKFYVHPVVGCLLDGIPIMNDTESIKRWNTRIPMQNIVERLEQQAELCRNRGFEIEQKGDSAIADKHYGKQCSYLHAIEIVKEEGGLNEN